MASSSVQAIFRLGSQFFNVLHLCALGGFARSLHLLQTLPFHKGIALRDLTYGQVAAVSILKREREGRKEGKNLSFYQIGGHMHMMDLIEQDLLDTDLLAKC